MRIVCSLCGAAHQVPDEKVPDRAFNMTCPACRGRFHVDPALLASEASWDAGDDTVATGEPPPAKPRASAPAVALAAPAAADPLLDAAPQRKRSPHDTGSLTRITPLPPVEQKLLDRLTPVAFVVAVEGGPMAELTDQLRLLGIDEVRHFTDLQEACEEALETDVGVLLVRLEKAPPPPCEPLAPIRKLPAETRRRMFTALVAENVRSLDGQVAFYLQVNCVLGSQELESLPVKLRRAILHHLKLYRYWSAED
jgi:hypothetical protein